MPRAKLRTPALKEHVLLAAVAAVAEERTNFTTRRIARDAGTSPAAIYELFDDRSGLLRAVYFEGFRLLGTYFDRLNITDDPVADLRGLFNIFRLFVQDNKGVAELMFSRPFVDFHPGAEEATAGAATRRTIVDHVDRCIRDGFLVGDATDIAHVFLGLAQGLALQETANWLGTSAVSMNRRWALAFNLLFGDGARCAGPANLDSTQI
jgi:AcrR family transcriptional regulator